MRARGFLRDSYAISNGKIDPWGTIRVLVNGVADPGNRPNVPFCAMNGLVLWSEKLVRYGNGQYYVKVLENTVGVFDKKNLLVEEVSHDEFEAVEIMEALIHDDGYLEKFIERPEVRWKNIYGVALRQAATGEKPKFLDNSPFIKVNTDDKFSGQHVVVLSWGIRSNYNATVFTKDGESIPSRVYYPLSFAKWEPRGDGAKHGITNPVR